MGEVERPVGSEPRTPGLEVFAPRDDDEDDNDWWASLGGAALASGLGLVLLLRWDWLVDGHYSRKTGGFERLLERIGQGPAAAVCLGAGAFFLLLAFVQFRRERTAGAAEAADTDDRHEAKETS